MKYRRWILMLFVLTQLASTGCLFGRRDCCGERQGLFSSMFHRKNRTATSGDCCSPCSGDMPAMATSGSPMMMSGAPDERLGAPAANRAWDGTGAPPAPLPKSTTPPTR